MVHIVVVSVQCRESVDREERRKEEDRKFLEHVLRKRKMIPPVIGNSQTELSLGYVAAWPL